MKLHKSNISDEIISSLPVRGAWVEIAYNETITEHLTVAPRAGSVG